MLSHISEVAKNYGKNENANARYDAEIKTSIDEASSSIKKMTESQRGKYLESIQGTPYRLMFDDAGEVATKQVSGYNADAMSVSLKQVSGNLKHAPAQAEISESAMKVKDTLEDIIGDRAHVVISDSMKTSADGTEGTRAFLDPETGVFYVNNKFKFDERFTELATAIHELYHAAEGTKQSAELHRALGEFVQAFPEVSDALTGGVGETIANDIIEYFDPKLNKAQQGYVNATEIDADILGKLLGSEEYVAKLAVRNENLVKKLYTYLKAAGKSTQSKQVRRALDKLTKKFGNALDHAKGGVLVSQIGDKEEKENTATSINEENMQVTVNDRASIKKIDGRDVVVIDTDQDVFDGVDRSEYGKVVRVYMKEHFRGKSIDNVKFKNRSEAEYTTSKYTQKIYNKKNGIYESKMRASTELDNLIKTGKLLGWESSKHPKEFNKNGYNRYSVEFVLDNKVFGGEMLVALSESDAMFYDIVKIKESSPTYNVANHKSSVTASNNTISQNKGVVNSNSMQNSEKDASNSKKSSSGINDRASKTNSRERLEDRVSGDELLDTQDLIEVVKEKGGEVDENGYITLYHRTSAENAEKIRSTGYMKGKEDGLFFSTAKEGYASGYGDTVVQLSIPAEKLVLDDIFDNEAHLKLPLKQAGMKNVRAYLVDESADSQRLTEDDLETYISAGTRANKSKLTALREGKKIILTSKDEITSFIKGSIQGERGLTTVAYGKVSDRLARDVESYSKGKIKITGNFLELVPDEINHAYKNHLNAKQDGDIDLSMDDFESIPEYIDNYDDLVYAINFESGNTRICLSKKLKNGRVVLIETVSKSRGSVEFKNIIGVSDEKYITEYENKYKKRSSSNTGGSQSSNISPHDKSASNNSIPQKSDLSTEKSKINDRSSKTGKDTVEMSRGEIEKLRANYMSEKVFDKKGVSNALNGITIFKKLPSDVRGKLIESIWTGFNEHRAYDRYIDVTTERLYATIMQETDFELYELDVDESKSAEKRR